MPRQPRKPKAGPRGGTTTVYESGLLRKTVYFNADEWEAIRRKSYQDGMSYAEVVRLAVRRLLKIED